MTDRPAATRHPVRTDGSAPGTSRCASVAHRDARRTRNRSRCPGWTERRPNSVFVVMGKIAMSTQTTTRLVNANPNQKPMTGMSARTGMVCRTTAQGYRERSSHRDRLITSADAVPSTMASARPVSATCADDASPASSSARLRSSSRPTRTTSCGGGSRNRRPSSRTP
jgi:hypothetical protein